MVKYYILFLFYSAEFKLDLQCTFHISSAITKYDFKAAVLYQHQSELHCTLEFTIHSFFVVSFNLNHTFNHSVANLICSNNKWFGRKSSVYLLSIPQD